MQLKLKKQMFLRLKKKIMNLIKEKPGLSENAYMGLVMAEMKGKIDGKTAIEMIKNLRSKIIFNQLLQKI